MEPTLMLFVALFSLSFLLKPDESRGGINATQVRSIFRMVLKFMEDQRAGSRVSM